ncbi:MAG: hypothetical protein WCF57_02090 [Pyrinomonadaceae bacterium]
MARKTKAQRDHEWREAERREWETFRPKLDALQSYAEARQLVAEAPPPDAPGRRYYSNLGFFLQNFTVPMGSSYAERALYLQFIQRLDADGALKPGVRQQVEEALRHAMKTQGDWS